MNNRGNKKPNKSKAMDLFATRLPKEEGRELKRISRSEKKTISSLLRTAVQKFIKNYKLIKIINKNSEDDYENLMWKNAERFFNIEVL